MMTPEKRLGEIDLTAEEDIPMFYGAHGEIENIKRKKMRDDLTDLVVNLKGKLIKSLIQILFTK